MQSDGQTIPFIDENLQPDNGKWLARSILYKMPSHEMKKSDAAGEDRGRDYNHSTSSDLIVTGLVGLHPRIDRKVGVNPLVPEGAMDYFCLDGLPYHEWNLTILWDRTGQRYRKGTGLRVFANGHEIGSAPGLRWLTANLLQTSAGWRKSEQNPLIGGGKLGTVFDIAVLNEKGKYRM
jgi:hypothetical protein